MTRPPEQKKPRVQIAKGDSQLRTHSTRALKTNPRAILSFLTRGSKMGATVAARRIEILLLFIFFLAR